MWEHMLGEDIGGKCQLAYRKGAFWNLTPELMFHSSSPRVFAQDLIAHIHYSSGPF